MHMKKANDDSLEETIRLSKGKNVFERTLAFILTIAGKSNRVFTKESVIEKTCSSENLP